MNTVSAAAHMPAIATGEAVMFWILAPLMIVAAIGLASCRKAVHGALCMVAIMLGLALIYISEGGIFIGVVQVVVYTGAIMMMIVFVIMMIGVAASDNYQKTSRSLRTVSWLAGAVIIALLSGFILMANLPISGKLVSPLGVDNPVAVGLSIFRDHTFSLVIADILLITAVVGSMLLNHADRLTVKATQINTLKARWESWRTRGIHIGQVPAPGVYATSNAVDVPAISGETGAPIPESVSRVLRARGLERDLGVAHPQTAEKLREQRHGGPGLHGSAANRSVARAGGFGMPGQKVTTGLMQKKSTEVAPTDPDRGEGQN
ncbi:MAG: NADH-quinone oxidoreductase subunit J [Actinomycetaceae bacterium]|nr:NADH-quinone oxidoreductase subunit J [Actinomycetaceae bacterium]